MSKCYFNKVAKHTFSRTPFPRNPSGWLLLNTYNSHLKKAEIATGVNFSGGGGIN